jgi:hypothetical protein
MSKPNDADPNVSNLKPDHNENVILFHINFSNRIQFLLYNFITIEKIKKSNLNKSSMYIFTLF